MSAEIVRKETAEIRVSEEKLKEMLGFGISKSDPKFLAISVAITMMSKCLKMMGRSVEGLAEPWYIVLSTGDITLDEIGKATRAFMAGENGNVFPEPAAFKEWIVNERTRQAYEECRDRTLETNLSLRERDRRAMNLERYGVEEPTREQIDARMSDNPYFKAITHGVEILPERKGDLVRVGR